MRVKLTISGRLPGLNEYIAAERTNRHAAAKMKREAQQAVEWCVRSQLRGVRFAKPVRMAYRWYERDKKRDKDNVSAFGRKVIQDALVHTGVLKNDNWACVDGFSDQFEVDKKRPRIEVEIDDENQTEKPEAGSGL